MSDILVVGAGPVGLTMAAELARYGVGVRIIDKSDHPTRTSKALAIWSRTLELMDRMGCTPQFLETGLHAHGATIQHGENVVAQVHFDDIASSYNFGLMIPQHDTERLLADHLRSFGVEVERQVELVSFSDESDHVSARLKHADGREEEVTTPWMVGCDGAHSSVRTGLDLEFRGSTQDDDWLLADVRAEGKAVPPNDRIGVRLHHDGPFVIFPIPGGRARIIVTVGKSEPGQTRSDPTLAEVQSIVDQRVGGGIQLSDPVWLSNFRINERKIAEYKHGRIFLAGDASHIHSPAGGQGMNTGMQDVINLAWKLAMVTRGQATTTLLDSYSPERSGVGEKVLHNAIQMTEIATLKNPVAQQARNMALRLLFAFHTVQDKVPAALSETEISYPDSPLSYGPHAGKRLAPSTYAGPPPGAGKEPRFVLYTTDEKRGAALAAQFPTLVEPNSRPPANPESLLVVRPDGYVGLVAKAHSWKEAENYLALLVPASGPVMA